MNMQHQTLNNVLVPSCVVAEDATRTTYSSAIPIDDTIPQNTEGTQIFSKTIPLQSATSKVSIKVFIQGATDTANAFLVISAFRGATANAIGTGFTRLVNTELSQAELFCMDSPATQGSVTYSVRLGISTGNFYTNGNSGARFFGGAAKCTLQILEIFQQ